jgi:hypothetical protein
MRLGQIGILNSASQLDPDAYAFLNASSNLGDTTIVSAINSLVIYLKENNFWSKIIACYPLVGGTSTKHKWNLKDPRDLDAAYRISFSGTITHNSNGVQGDGSTGYGNIHLNPDAIGSGLSGYLYNRTEGQSNTREFGALTTTPNSQWGTIGIRRTDNTYIARPFLGTGDSSVTAAATTCTGGFYMGRIDATTGVVRKNNSAETTFPGITLSSTSITVPIFLLGFNNGGTASSFSNRNFAFFCFFNQYLSDADTFHNGVQTFQTTLGRNV